jgi:ADP-ribose pyrophosphatase
MTKLLSSKILHDGFFQLKQDLLEHSSGEIHPYTTLVLPVDAASVLAKDEAGRWILNREYRYPTGKHLLGAPGGRIDPNENPIDGARREFFEETGYWADHLEPLGVSYPFPGICNQRIHFFYAPRAIKKGSQKLDLLESIETELKTEEELRKEILSGGHVDGILCTALWYFQNSR